MVSSSNMQDDLNKRDEKDSAWLEEYIKKRGISGRIIHTPDVPTVEKASERVGCSKKQIFKSIVFVSESGKGIIGVVDGESRVDREKLERICGEKLRFSTKEEVKSLTGYSAGGVSPFGSGCEVFIDEKLMDNDVVYGGGGDESHLIEIPPEELLKEGKLSRISR
jgi:prolyl-tRNA editing enzyme YbaK/EbsC (Cys-tRNA(Pro) deacylase)